jgi:hypothetical protein
VLATTHTGFRALMSNKASAVSLVNAVLTATIPSFERIAHLEAGETLVRLDDGGQVTMDFHGKAEGDRHVIIDLQAEVADYFRRECLFFAALAFAGAGCRRVGSGDGAGPAEASRNSATGKVYAIQLVSYDLRELPPEAGPIPDSRRHCGVSARRIGRVYLVQIDFPRIAMTFPIAGDATSGWEPFDWWVYMFRFSQLFTESEIRRCRRLGMPAEVGSSLQSLKRESWSEDAKREYMREVATVPTDFARLAKARSDAGEPARLVALLQGLSAIFLEAYSLDEDDVQDIKSGLPEALVRKAWDAHKNRRKTEDQYQPFLRALRENGVIIT